MNKAKLIKIFSITALAIALGLYLGKGYIFRKAFSPTSSQIQQGVNTGSEEVVTENLDTPWEMVFLPDGSILATERSGTIQRILKDKTVISIPGVVETSEGGLLGMTLHPDFENNRKIYFYFTTRDGGRLANRVDSFVLADNVLTSRQTVVGGIPGSSNHDGGRIAFGPDNLLYIATGDAGNEQAAQDTGSLSGKILRVKDDGSIPGDNPFSNAVYSFGHRNPQGLAWDDNGNLWSTEHGPSGIGTGYDELNKIEKGSNYGWPIIKGDEKKAGMVSPTANSGSDETWAPAGLAYYEGALYFAGLRGQTLYKTILKNGSPEPLTGLLQKKYGRLRAVVAGPDGYLYVSTSNKDGRGQPKEGDDKIIKLKF
jgi:glucose/arabinose dehydrogenase